MKIDIIKVTKENVTKLKSMGLKRIPTLMYNNSIIEGVESIKSFLITASTQFLNKKKMQNSQFQNGQFQNGQFQNTSKREQFENNANSSLMMPIKKNSDNFDEYLIGEALNGSKLNTQGKIEFNDNEPNEKEASANEFNKKMREMDQTRKSKVPQSEKYNQYEQFNQQTNKPKQYSSFKETLDTLQKDINKIPQKKLTDEQYENEFESRIVNESGEEIDFDSSANDYLNSYQTQSIKIDPSMLNTSNDF
jgi:hypothetical protein